MATSCRLIIDSPHSGAWNMAVDEVLLESAAERDLATLRFYAWSEPTLSLGYFQPYAERDRHAASRRCSAVRRSTGGGAILHDREITYALALPANQMLSIRSDRLYRSVHEGLVSVLNKTLGQLAGPQARICEKMATPASAPFLCFERRAQDDVLLGGGRESPTQWKIAGSAQRRRRGAVLQHGSVLFSTSSYAPELPGIEEVTGAAVEPTALIAEWTQRIASSLELDVEPKPLAVAEARFAEWIATERFASPVWTNRR